MALLSLALVYVVGINVFLSTPLFHAVMKGAEDDVAIRYERGWSILPGRVHAKQLSIRGRDSNVEWILRIDDANFDVSLFNLARQRFLVSRVHGKGVTFRVRQRLEHPPTSPAEVAHLPPIEGLPPWSLRPPDAGKSPERWSDEAYHLWTVGLENVTAEDVREIWFDRERFEGLADIRGRFYLKPLRQVNVGPVNIDVHEGSIATGGPSLITPLVGTAEVAIATFDPRIASGADIAGGMTLRTDLHGVCGDMNDLAFMLPPGLQFHGRLDIERLALNVTEGVMREGTTIDIRTPDAVVVQKDSRYSGAAVLHAAVARVGPTPKLGFVLDAKNLDVKRHGGSGQLVVRAPSVTVNGDAADLEVAHFAHDLHLKLVAPDLQIPDARALGEFIPRDTPVAIANGRARASVNLESWFDQKRTAGSAKLRADELDVSLAKVRMRGSFDAEIASASHHWHSSRLDDVALTVMLDEGSLAAPVATGKAKPIIEARDLRASVKAKTLDLEDPLAELEADLQTKNAMILDRGLLHAYMLGGPETTISSGRGRFALQFHVSLHEHRAKGELDLLAEELGLTHHDVQILAGVHAHARVSNWVWERGDLTLDDARIDVTDIRVSKPNQRSTLLGYVSLRAKSPRFTFASPLEDLSVVARAQFPDVHALAAFLPPDSVVSIDGGAASLAADLTLSTARKIGRGTFELAVAQGDVTVRGRTRVAGNVQVCGQVNGYDAEADRFDVSGSRISFDEVSVARKGKVDTAHWHASVVLRDAGFELAPAELSGDVDMGARDASAILGLLLKGIPKIVANLGGTPNLEAQARLTAGPSRFVLDDLWANGGNLTVRGLMGVRGARSEGAFIVRKGPFSAGVRLDDEGTRLRFFGLDRWLAEQAREVRAHAAVPPPAP
ncbi:hypothetical protein AKJ09_07324 [Labilithrix luteola]|uniref:AsmA-like C-terminal domain-containing protein n=1 Tax=Labilithrix luteola TaxID=1391654 RepID=A0A0K1Q499_9BACT|nr:hypothetical protein [Labilithrix luteola]AKV00661.1 hypothetical protein AKJ09_07324 [Labilithrix luteola]